MMLPVLDALVDCAGMIPSAGCEFDFPITVDSIGTRVRLSLELFNSGFQTLNELCGASLEPDAASVTVSLVPVERPSYGAECGSRLVVFDRPDQLDTTRIEVRSEFAGSQCLLLVGTNTTSVPILGCDLLVTPIVAAVFLNPALGSTLRVDVPRPAAGIFMLQGVYSDGATLRFSQGVQL